MICYSTLLEGAIQLPERSTTMACKAVFYLKATALLLTLAVSSLVGCGGSSFSAADLSDSGVTTDVTGGQSSVISSQSSVRTSTGGQSAVSSQTSVISQTGGQASDIGGRSSVVSQTGGQTSVTTTSNNYYEVYSSTASFGSSSLTPGECPTGQSRTDCICVLGGGNSFTAFNSTCSYNTLSNCIANGKTAVLPTEYTYFWSCS